ncbi:bidirectional sugar transporter NEC1-like [Cynara cardunculus var. scolymus]|uniref:bidirectional sugar transporter NEC1-like n=1 Tax=Cynara cardunculus var. scolymus TaxID=59895 RepID=UPI000D62CA33|nr:bidirectional sugar transporter NEC1-like [Cynara cardunculus var. scolymus]
MAFPTHILPSVFGILGNIISFCVFLAPLPTFYRIYKKKSTEGFQSVPYSVSLFSCMLLLYYGYLKTENGMMIITINAIGCAIETAYIVVFLIYATRESLMYTIKLLVLFNIGSYGLIVITTLLTSQGSLRVMIVGWICAVFSVCVFAAPLSIIRLVIRTRSVEYMPFSLSFFLTICAVLWFFYGLLIKDYYVATPNVLGFVFGVTQMILYMIYKDKKKQVRPVVQPQDGPAATVVDLGAILEMKEKAGVDLGAILEMQEKAGSVAGDEAVGEKKEEVTAKVSLGLDGEKTIMPTFA